MQDRVHCSWRDKGQHEVELMFEGFAHVAVCSECIELMCQFAKERRDKAGLSPHESAMVPSTVPPP